MGLRLGLWLGCRVLFYRARFRTALFHVPAPIRKIPTSWEDMPGRCGSGIECFYRPNKEGLSGRRAAANGRQ